MTLIYEMKREALLISNYRTLFLLKDVHEASSAIDMIWMLHCSIRKISEHPKVLWHTNEWIKCSCFKQSRVKMCNRGIAYLKRWSKNLNSFSLKRMCAADINLGIFFGFRLQIFCIKIKVIQCPAIYLLFRWPIIYYLRSTLMLE